MASINVSNMTVGFAQQVDGFVSYLGILTSGSQVFFWTTQFGSVLVQGTGFTYDAGGDPTGGTVTEITINTNVAQTESVSITNLSVPLVDLVASPHSFWETVLDGATDYGALDRDFRAHGDFIDLTSGSHTGAADTFDGDGTAGMQAFGDADDVITGAILTGGNDTFSGAIDWIVGDAATVNNATLIGGADMITMDELLDISSGTNSILIHGDAETSTNGSVTGGNDVIDTGANVGVRVYGDVDSILNNGFLNGGDDTITFRSGVVYGDANLVSGSSALIFGGNDTISAAMGTEGVRIYGDLNSSSGNFMGGNDHITGSVFNDVIYGDLFGVTVDSASATYGDDIIHGGGGADVIVGDAQIDSRMMPGTGGSNELYGEAGDDELYGGLGNDIIDGGANTDTAFYRSANSLVSIDLALQGVQQDTGGAGLDTISNVENLVGSDFDDTLRGDINANEFEGGNGNDQLQGRGGADTLHGGDGDDTIRGGNGGDELNGNANDDTLEGGSGNDTLNGGADNDTLTGGDDNDTVDAGEGNDKVIALLSDGDDTYTGGAGFDILDFSGVGGVIQINQLGGVITGSAGNDTLMDVFEQVIGSNFDDVLSGGNGGDVLDGNDGNDQFFANGGDDLVRGGNDNDTFFFSTNDGNDRLEGGAGFDVLDYSSLQGVVQVNQLDGTTTGTANNDTLLDVFEQVIGTNFDDVLSGGHGINVLNGGGGDDQLFANNGDDQASGGAGNDTITLGLGDDRLDFRNGDQLDTVTDFNAGAGSEDQIILTFHSAATSFAQMQSAGMFSQQGADTHINLGGGDTIILQNIMVGALHQDDFIF